MFLLTVNLFHNIIIYVNKLQKQLTNENHLRGDPYYYD